jgi:ATP-binding cassette subfamily B protein
MPKGLDTSLSEWGTSVSAGQRQRLAIARSLIRETPILVLDEATANIDVQTELDLLRGLFGRLKEETIIYVTHRISSASLADQVCVIEGGAIVGLGSHPFLLATNPSYRRMFSIPTITIESRLTAGRRGA